MDLNTAIQAHSEWKMKFRSAIQKSEKLDAAAIGVDNKCPLGQWLHGEGKTRFGQLGTYANCRDLHATFHREAAKVATAINSGDLARASSMLENGTSYTVASNQVGVAIIALKKEAKI